jgi:hemoglobin/transferrin/lactoferrin receptor protein
VTASASAIGVVTAREAEAQSTAQAITFSVPAGPLNQALAVFGRQSGLQVTYLASVASGKTSPGFSGQGTRQQALARILEGSGLGYSFPNATTVAISGPGAGSNTTATVDGAIALDTIDVSGGGGPAAATDAPYQTPGSNAYISRETLDRLPVTSAADMFKNTPGVLGNSGRNGPQMDLNIRGMQGMNRVKVMVEGTQQDSSIHRGYNGPDNRVYVDQDLISGISIEKGAGTGPYGSGTTGGVVDMRTLTPDDILLDGKSYGVRLRGMTVGNMTDPSPTGTAFGAGFARENWFDLGSGHGSASAAFAYRDTHFEFVAGVARRRHGNYFAGENGRETYLLYQYSPPYTIPPAPTRYSMIPHGGEVLNTSEDTTSTLLKAKFKFGDGHSIELGHIGYDSTFGYIYPLDTAPPGRRYIQEPPSRAQSDRFYARYRWNPAENDLVNFSANAWMTKGTEFTNGLSRIPATSDLSSYGVEIWNVSKWQSAIGHWTFTYGAEHAKSEIDQYPGNPIYAFGGNREVSGAYAKAKWTPIDLITFNGGVRYDMFETEGPSGACVGSTCTFTPSGNTGSAFSPSAGVMLEPIKGLQLFAQYNEGFRPPSIRESIGTSQSGVIPNPGLRAERSRGWEYGLNVLRTDLFARGDKSLLKVAYFDTFYSDYIALSYDNPTVQPQFQNVQSVKLTGWEISGSYDAGVFFALGNVTIYDTVEYCLPGNSTVACNSFLGAIGSYEGVPPKHSGSVTLGTRLFDQKLTLGGRAFFFGNRATGTRQQNGATLFNFVQWRPDIIFDAFASYRLNESLEFSTSIENIFDRYYLEPLSIARAPSPGRTLRAAFTMKF